MILYTIALSIGSLYDLVSTFLEMATIGKGFAPSIFVFLSKSAIYLD